MLFTSLLNLFRRNARLERRASPRRTSMIRVLVVNPEDALDYTYPGLVLDFSRGGVCLSCANCEHKEGTVLRVKLDSDDDPAHGWIDLEVKYCSGAGDWAMLGCQFRGDARLALSLSQSVSARQLSPVQGRHNE
jgi:hypothetical protein